MKKILLALLLMPMLTIGQNIELAKGLVAHYAFDGNAKDISGKANNGILPSKGVKFETGKLGKAVKFYSSSHIKIPNSSSLKFYNEVSFSVWVKTYSSESQTIFAKRHDRSGYFAKINIDNGKFRTWFGNNAYSSPKFSISAKLESSYKKGDWVHIVYVFTKNTAKIYLNGKLISTENNLDVNLKIANNNDLYVGKFNDRWYPLNGGVDEFRIYNRVLKGNEIQALYGGKKGSSIQVATKANTSTTDLTHSTIPYKDIQINDEASFILLDIEDDFVRWNYIADHSFLFLLNTKSIKLYDFSKSFLKPEINEIPIDFIHDKIKSTSGHIGFSRMSNNEKGTLVAVMDNDYGIHVFDVRTKSEIKVIPIKEKWKNFIKTTPKEEPIFYAPLFSFISDFEILISGTKYAAIYNIESDKIEYLKLENKILPTYKLDRDYIWKEGNYKMVISKEFYPEDKYPRSLVYKVNENRKLTEFNNSYWLRYFIRGNFYHNKEGVFRKQNDEKITIKNGGFYYCDINEKAYIKGNVIELYNKDLSFNINKIYTYHWSNDYKYLIGFKKNLKGIMIFNFSNIESEMEKQYFLKANDLNTNSSYEKYLSAYPNSTYKDTVNGLLDVIHKKGLAKIMSLYKDNKLRVLQLYAYQNTYPKSNYILDSQTEINRIYKDVFEEISYKKDANKLEKYIVDYSKSPYLKKAKNLVYNIYETEYDRVKIDNTISEFRKYINSYAKSPFIAYAKKAITRLEKSEKEEQNLAVKAKNGNYRSCELYMEMYPSGMYLAEVQKVKNDIDNRAALIESGKNHKTWNLGDKVCLDKSGGIICGSINQWNENKSSAQIKIITSSGGTLEGEDLTKNNLIWIKTTGIGWHLCLDDEIKSSIRNDKSAVVKKPEVKIVSPSYCSKCGGSGNCLKCNGRGTRPCNSHDTNGDGYCTDCNNTGIEKCYSCYGKGTCSSCGGRGR